MKKPEEEMTDMKVWGDEVIVSGVDVSREAVKGALERINGEALKGALGRINLKRMVLMAPRCVTCTSKRTVMEFMGVRFAVRHSRRKVKNKRTYRLIKFLVEQYRQMIARGCVGRLAGCDTIRIDFEPARDDILRGRMTIDVTIGPPQTVREVMSRQRSHE